MAKKRALISVFDKTNIVEFAEKLIKFDYEIISTGGTFKTLKENNIPVIEVKDVTGFEEILSGRVKTLHPNIFGGILARLDNNNDLLELEKNNIAPINLVVVNLYPFEQEKTIETIDIGGVALIRAAAKNYAFTNVLTSVNQYDKFIGILNQNNGETTEEYRKLLAIKAFKLTSKYDNLIAKILNDNELEETLTLNLEKVQDLRYGENPYQSAGLYKMDNNITDFTLLNGKELSFNNIADMSSAFNLVSEFIGVYACAIIKHANPCGVALGDDVADAYQRALDCDPISAFGGIVAFNQKVDLKTAKMMKEIFLEVIIAPDFDKEAVDYLKQKKNLRLVRVNEDVLTYKNTPIIDIKNTKFGTLIQTKENVELNKDTFKVVTQAKPDEDMVEDMIFAWKVVKHVKSNAIVVAKNKKLLGVGMGQTSRIASMEIALNQACDESKDAVVASDGFFPAIDNIQAAAQSRIAAIIQPGGSIKDNDVIAECDKYNIAMITTGMREFLH
ncbi:MAG: bifunctional phosphoribosylaminoimidazolecarboxamide formyltransferase/IMP cyclohydrolase [Candidatus Gastranaerophilales bacterium]|nr:bifunctional phosphoribosylaminoimidazolecarboxamide formyltransferase/IMP cyclohydrolase [Candidatus Gastranaerophilales bacterium]